MVNCKYCNCIIAYGHKYCRNCGIELSEDLLEMVSVEYEKEKRKKEIEEICTEESSSSEVLTSDLEEDKLILENTETDDQEADEAGLSSIQEVKHKKFNIKDILKKEEVKVILTLLAAIIIFISGALAKNTIFAMNESYGINDNLAIVSDGNAIYFTDIYTTVTSSSSMQKLPTFKLENNKVQKIYEGYAFFLNAKNKWLYFVEEKEGIYKMKSDGTSKQELFKGISSNLKLQGKFLYFMPYNDIAYLGELYKMKLDGSEIEKISSDVLIYEIIGNSIVYSSNSELGTVYRMDLNGNNKIKLCTIDGTILYVKNGYIYYRSKEGNNMSFDHVTSPGTAEYELQQKIEFLYSNGNLCRVKLDGTDKKVVLTGSITQTTFYNNFIIYHDYDGIYKIDLNGENKVKILEKNFNSPGISVINNYLYYYDVQDNKLYKKSLKTNEEASIELKQN